MSKKLADMHKVDPALSKQDLAAIEVPTLW